MESNLDLGATTRVSRPSRPVPRQRRADCNARIGSAAAAPLWILIVALCCFSACPGAELRAIPPEELRIEKFSGDDQRGTAGSALPRPLLVRVYEDAYDRPPVADAGVRFEVIAGSAQIVAASNVVTSDRHGVAGAAILLGDMDGPEAQEEVIVRASLDCDPARQVRFHLAKERPSLRVTRIWDAARSTALPGTPPRVRIGDPYLMAVEVLPDTDVRIRTTAGTAEFFPGSDRWTGESGRHRIVFVARAPGQLTLELSLLQESRVPEKTTLSFLAVSATDPSTDRLQVAVASGDRQFGADSRDLAQPIVLRLTRGADRPAPGARVSFESFDGRARIESLDAAADEQGRIRVRYVCPPKMELVDAVRVIAVARSQDGLEEAATTAFVVRAPTTEFVEEQPGTGGFVTAPFLSAAFRLQDEQGRRAPWPDRRTHVEVRCRDFGPTVRVELKALDRDDKPLVLPVDTPVPAVRELELHEVRREETHVVYRSGPLLCLSPGFDFAGLTPAERTEIQATLRLFGREVFLCGDSAHVHGPLPAKEAR